MIKRLLDHLSILAGKKYLRIMAGFYILSILTSFFNFLYYPVMARISNPHVYGEIQFLVTIIFQITIVFMALNVITIILSVRYRTNKQQLHESIAALSSLFNILTVCLTTLAVGILIFFRHNLQFDSPLAFIALGISIISTVPFTIGVGKLQGQERFIAAGILSMGGSFLKLLISTGLVLAGFGAEGAVIGIGVGQVIAVIAAVSIGSLSLSEIFNFKPKNIRPLREDRMLIVIAGLSVIVTNLIITADTIGAKLLLDPTDAGIYAGIATLAKIAVYVVSPLMWIVIASAAEPHRNTRKINLIIKVSCLMCIGLILAYIFLPKLIVTLLIGTQYLTTIHLLVLTTTAMSTLTIAALLNTILVASARLKAIILHAGVILFSFFFYLWIFGTQLEMILWGQLVAGVCGIAYYVGYKLIHQRGFQNEHQAN